MNALLTRRRAIGKIATGMVGLTSAALVGCTDSDQGRPRSAPAEGSAGTTGKGGGTRPGGLILSAPRVEGSIRRGGVWTRTTPVTGTEHDPAITTSSTIWSVISERGLEPDVLTGVIRPHGFISWEVADPGGSTLVLKLHPKLFIHDKPPWNGRQFTAEDAAWSIMRGAGLFADRLKIPVASFHESSVLTNMTRAEAVDPLTVKVTLSRPNPGFFRGLMDPRAALLPKEMDDVGWRDPLKMAGIGPFVVSDWAGSRTAFTRNPRYEGFRPGEPYFDQYRTLAVGVESFAEYQEFMAGRSQATFASTPAAVATMRQARPEANVYQWIGQSWGQMRPSMKYLPFGDARVRRALFLALDYQAIGDGYYADKWVYQASLNPSFAEAWQPERVKQLLGYNPDTKEIARQEAARLLAAAGYPDGAGLEFAIHYVEPVDGSRDHATRAQVVWNQVFSGMRVRLRSYGGTDTFSVAQRAGNFELALYAIGAAPDPVIELASQYRTNGTRNFGKFSDPQLDSLVDRATTELDQQTRGDLLEQAQQRFVDDWLPAIVMNALPTTTLVQGDIGGFDTTAGPWFGFSSTSKICRWYYVQK